MPYRPRNSDQKNTSSWQSANKERIPKKVSDMAIKPLLPYRKNVLTITTDNGIEFTCHKTIAKALGTTSLF